jgi:hypothetical protein
MTPLPDRTVLLGLLGTLLLIIALVFWSVRSGPGAGQQPMLWRETPAGSTAQPMI